MALTRTTRAAQDQGVDRGTEPCAACHCHLANMVKTLSDRIETLSAREYMRLRAAADEARLDSEIARTELEQHKRIHTRDN
jgi:hypothetical protein